MSVSNFNVCSFNKGTDIRDYAQLCAFANVDATEEMYAAAEVRTAEAMPKDIHVFCFQEFAKQIGIGKYTTDIPLINDLKARNFEFIGYKGAGDELPTADPVIAIDRNRFKDIQTIFCNNARVIITAVDIETAQRFTFASAHVAGFGYNSPDMAQEAEYGDNECVDMVHQINQRCDSDVEIIGADTNAGWLKWPKRFSVFFEQGFLLAKTGLPTNVNCRDFSDREREIDYFLVRQEKLGIIARIFRTIFSTSMIVEHKVKADVTEGFWHWDPSILSSDHRPICLAVTTHRSYSYMARLTMWAKSFF